MITPIVRLLGIAEWTTPTVEARRGMGEPGRRSFTCTLGRRECKDCSEGGSAEMGWSANSIIQKH